MKRQSLVSIAALTSIFSTPIFAGPTWTHGSVDIVESYGSFVRIAWDGENTQGCAYQAVDVTAASLGSEDALDRALKIAMGTALSGNKLRFYLNGCTERGAQSATVVQVCMKPNCEHRWGP